MSSLFDQVSHSQGALGESEKRPADWHPDPIRHLIADHLGWFDSDDLTQGGKYRTIEDLMRSKGVEVRRSSVFELDGSEDLQANDAKSDKS